MEYSAKTLTNKVLEVIKKDWPIHPSGVCRHINIDLSVTNISKIKYHFKILENQGKIRTKKIDRALAAWPLDIEKLRVMHELINEWH